MGTTDTGTSRIRTQVLQILPATLPEYSLSVMTRMCRLSEICQLTGAYLTFDDHKEVRDAIKTNMSSPILDLSQAMFTTITLIALWSAPYRPGSILSQLMARFC